ncbi:hypothetical protein [Ulvibacter litoralis]|uniref:Uncharacterized protein n=1 Tax=Ulvibacter litoralis TaxID=227084 RepID=A0A1G7GIU1_9FLAO|nr:hypothetical protein [Ulvibacter litoralis]GHC56025.1 hypothetical protein GCM10008083_20590 [Ulvibacter litoralis]SDE88011.1 hypothetical protein SAMN05421855_103163 [Ulvibacter litoralis]
MKTTHTYIAIITLLFSISTLFAQGTEGVISNSNYETNRLLDARQSENSQKLIADESSNSGAIANRLTAANLINYQAVARDAGGNLLINAAVTIGFNIHEGTAGGPSVFTETQNLTTDANGVFSTQIGAVSALSVNWGANAHFLEVSLNGTSVGTTEFVSVPYAKSADSMPAEAIIGDGASNADVVTISGDNTVVGEIMDIRATNVVGAANDIVNLEMPAGSSEDAQFIEARNGGAVAFQVQGDGRTLINTTTTAPQLNTVYGNSMPIAFGSVALGFDDIQTGYGIASFSNPATGEYDIVLDHETNGSNCVVLVTPFTTGFGTPEIAGYEPTGPNSFKIRIQTVAGVARDSAFTFVVYGNH